MISCISKSLKVLHVFLAAFLVLAAASGSAQALLSKGEYSEEEKVGFAFYKLGGIKPDFDSWAKNTNAYFNTLPAQKSQFLQDEISRLEQGFHNFQTDEDMVVVRSPVEVVTSDFASPDPKYTQMGITKHSVIVLENAPSAYLPFQIVNTWVAIIPHDYSSFINMYLTDEQFEKLRKSLNYRDRFKEIRFQGDIELILRPVTVDVDKPIKIEGKDMWLMGAEIASMTIWERNDKEKIIWEYSAPWYVTGSSKQLLNLYDE